MCLPKCKIATELSKLFIAIPMGMINHTHMI